MTKSNIKQPHDELFKASLQYPKVAREFLSLFLPDAIKKDLDLERITYCSTKFISAQLKESESDVLLQTKIANRDAYIYILTEHQSTVDKLMPLRLLHYMTSIWQEHCKRKGNANALPLPLIFPLVFYTGKDDYKGMRTVWDLCGENASQMQTILQTPFHLIDVNTLSEEELIKHVWAGTFSFVMRERFKKNLYSDIKKIAANLNDIGLETQGYYLVELFNYILNASEGASINKIVGIIHDQLSPHVEDEIMTIADSLRKEGWEKGMEKGREEGVIQEKRTTALNMLDLGSDLPFISKVTGLSLSQIKLLQEDIKSTLI